MALPRKATNAVARARFSSQAHNFSVELTRRQTGNIAPSNTTARVPRIISTIPPDPGAGADGVSGVFAMRALLHHEGDCVGLSSPGRRPLYRPRPLFRHDFEPSPTPCGNSCTSDLPSDRMSANKAT